MGTNHPIIEEFANTIAGNIAREYFIANGLPNKNNEQFHFTDISRGLNQEIKKASIFYEYPMPIGEIEIRLFNDRISILGSSKNIITENIQLENSNDIFQKLINGLAHDAVKLKIAANCNSKISIIRFPNSRACIDIEIGENSNLEIIEKQEAGGGLSSFSCNLNIEKNAKVEYISQLFGENIDLSSIKAMLFENSQFNKHFFAFGGQMIRRNLDINFHGKNGKTKINGCYLIDKAHFDFSSKISHLSQQCETYENIRGIVSSQGHGIFQGLINVARDAQKTIGKMEHRAIMLEEGARINAKPCLEIYADDVECSHANTIGALDDKALFYMQSRGISKTTAKALLTQAFLQQVFDETDEINKIEILKQIDAKLREMIK